MDLFLCLGEYIIFSGTEQARQCAVTMEHVELWYCMATKNFSLTLILEDDVILVPYFTQKFNCFIRKVFEADTAVTSNKGHEMLAVGSCMNFHGEAFRYMQHNSTPFISSQKTNASRCSHAYTLTSRWARMLADEVKRLKNSFAASDIFLRNMYARSDTLKSLWLDPPLAYQGNQIYNLDNVDVFLKKSY